MIDFPRYTKSIYTTLFNFKSFSFNPKDVLANFSVWADEVVVATIEDDDNTYKSLLELTRFFPKLKVIKTNLQRFTPTFDGDLKNAALQATTGDILLQLDFDEKMSTHNLLMWDKLSEMILSNKDIKAAFIPSINLYGDKQHFSSFTSKWYLHKRGLKRGVVNFAKKADGTHDIGKSDSCELLDQDGNLVQTFRFFDESLFDSKESAAQFLKDQDLPYVIHYGWIDLHRRADINKQFWKNQWSAEAGQDVDIPISFDKIELQQSYKHDLMIP
jgi:hypothetical protein